MYFIVHAGTRAEATPARPEMQTASLEPRGGPISERIIRSQLADRLICPSLMRSGISTDHLLGRVRGVRTVVLGVLETKDMILIIMAYYCMSLDENVGSRIGGK